MTRNLVATWIRNANIETHIRKYNNAVREKRIIFQETMASSFSFVPVMIGFELIVIPQ